MENFEKYLSPFLKLVSEESHQIQLELEIPLSLPYFEGHFDHNPILPGIISIEISSWLIINYFSLSCDSYTSIKKTKFKNIIKPNDKVDIFIAKKGDAQYRVLWKRLELTLLDLTILY